MALESLKIKKNIIFYDGDIKKKIFFGAGAGGGEREREREGGRREGGGGDQSK